MKFINIGFGNIVLSERIIAIVSPESAPIKRLVSEARDRTQLVDATYGRRTRSVIIADSEHVILSAIQPETVAHRVLVAKTTKGQSLNGTSLNSPSLSQPNVNPALALSEAH